MSTTKKHSDLEEIISYTPPQLYTGKEWYIGFMAFDPALNTMHRKKTKLNKKIPLARMEFLLFK